MNTSLTNSEAQLLVDIESGRLLRCDDAPRLSLRYLDSHPFIESWDGGTHFAAGPDANRYAHARARGEHVGGLDAVEYETTSAIGGYLTLQKVEEA